MAIFVSINSEGRAVAFYDTYLMTPPADAFEISDAIYNDWADNQATRRWDGTQLVAVEIDAPSPSRMVSSLEFRQRFTMDERMAITLAASKALEQGDARLQVFLDDLSSSGHVDLDHAEIVDGVQFIVDAKLVSKARGDEILK